MHVTLTLLDILNRDVPDLLFQIRPEPDLAGFVSVNPARSENVRLLKYHI